MIIFWDLWHNNGRIQAACKLNILSPDRVSNPGPKHVCHRVRTDTRCPLPSPSTPLNRLASLAHRSTFATSQLSRNYTEMDKSDKAIKSPSSSQRATSETQSNRSLEKLVAKDRLSCSTQRGNSALGQRHHTQKTVKHTKPSVRGRAHQRQCGKPFLSAICVEGIRFTMHLSF